MRKNRYTGRRATFDTYALTVCALLTALSVVLARLLTVIPSEVSRYSLEAIPIVLAGLLFGAVPGAAVGFAADFIGCLFSPYGYNPIFCLPPILYGVFAGLARGWLGRGVNLAKLAAAFLPPVLLGSVLWQSAALAFIYNSKGSFMPSFIFFLSTRAVQFAVTLALDVLVIFLLFRANIFSRMRVWPPQGMKADAKN